MPAKRYQFFTPSNNRLLIVVGFLALLALVVWLVSGVPKPREADRVFATDQSFSLIHPPDWDVDRRSGDGQSAYLCAVATSPKKSVGREIRLFFGEYKKPMDAATLNAGGYKSITFQGQTALARGIRNKHDFTYMMVFQQQARSFEISVRLPFEEDIPQSEWWPYFSSFRLNPRPATISATTPS